MLNHECHRLIKPRSLEAIFLGDSNTPPPHLGMYFFPDVTRCKLLHLTMNRQKGNACVHKHTLNTCAREHSRTRVIFQSMCCERLMLKAFTVEELLLHQVFRQEVPLCVSRSHPDTVALNKRDSLTKSFTHAL